MWKHTSGWGLSYVKRFFETENGSLQGSPDHSPFAGRVGSPPDLAGVSTEGEGPSAPGPSTARIAVYDDPIAAPRVVDVTGSAGAEFIEALATRVYDLARDAGGALPYTVIREVVENLIHARFAEVVVSILDRGGMIRFSDHGPGIEDKERSFSPGFTTATSEMKRVIRGVGSGLPIVKEYLSLSGGYVTVEDNLGVGTVVTLRLEPPAAEQAAANHPMHAAAPVERLSTRQKQVLSLVMELGSIGPSVVARELSVALSTAYRDLAALEEEGLLFSDEAGKRSLTDVGVSYLDALFAT